MFLRKTNAAAQLDPRARETKNVELMRKLVQTVCSLSTSLCFIIAAGGQSWVVDRWVDSRVNFC